MHVCRPHVAGVSILLIPFSSDFVDSLCIAAVLGFLCEVGNKLISVQGRRDSNSRVAVSAGERTEIQLECDLDELAVAQIGPSKEVDTANPCSSSTHETDRARAPLKHTTQTSPDLLERRRTSVNGKELRALHRALPSRASFRQSLLLASMSSRNTSLSAPAGSRRNSHDQATAAPLAGPVVLHWGIALVAMTELVLSAIHNNQKNDAA